MKRRIRTLTPGEEKRLLEACRELYEVDARGRRNAGGRNGRKRTKDKREWTQLKNPPDYLYGVTLTAMRCGLRRGTILKIRWKEVDFKKKQWRIPGEFMKTAREYAAPMPESVVAMLKEYRQTLSGEKHATTRLKTDSPIFGLTPRSSFTHAFQGAVRRAGLDGLTFHDLRRHYLNKLCRSGVPIDVAMSMSGHASLQTVMTHYREVSEEEQRRAAVAVDRELETG